MQASLKHWMGIPPMYEVSDDDDNDDDDEEDNTIIGYIVL